MFYAPILVFGGTDGVGSRFQVLRPGTRFRRYRVRRVTFSCFALPKTPNSFSTVPRSSDPVSMFCAPRHVFGSAEGVGSCFHVLSFRTHFRQFRGRRVQFSCFALPDSFSVDPRASGPIFMFYAPILVFGRTDSVGSRFHVLRPGIRFPRYRVRRVTFSCFALRDTFLAVPSASGLVFMFCAP
jgi:hypothetical protein